MYLGRGGCWGGDMSTEADLRYICGRLARGTGMTDLVCICTTDPSYMYRTSITRSSLQLVAG